MVQSPQLNKEFKDLLSFQDVSEAKDRRGLFDKKHNCIILLCPCAVKPVLQMRQLQTWAAHAGVGSAHSFPMQCFFKAVNGVTLDLVVLFRCDSFEEILFLCCKTTEGTVMYMLQGKGRERNGKKGKARAGKEKEGKKKTAYKKLLTGWAVQTWSVVLSFRPESLPSCRKLCGMSNTLNTARLK